MFRPDDFARNTQHARETDTYNPTAAARTANVSHGCSVRTWSTRYGSVLATQPGIPLDGVCSISSDRDGLATVRHRQSPGRVHAPASAPLSHPPSSPSVRVMHSPESLPSARPRSSASNTFKRSVGGGVDGFGAQRRDPLSLPLIQNHRLPTISKSAARRPGQSDSAPSVGTNVQFRISTCPPACAARLRFMYPVMARLSPGAAAGEMLAMRCACHLAGTETQSIGQAQGFGSRCSDRSGAWACAAD